ncbi:complex I NDUFA9 subunit family protein [Methylibium sp.]|uniref:complex I NDUFA9 subunit family protein n=1 Tax=Methylibium sp. TaxID=2067992 RepID=UPI003D0DD9D0
MKNLLILGGTGFVGSALCEKLVEHFGAAGARLTVPSRRPQRAKQLAMLPTVELVEADLHDDGQLTRLLLGRDAVVNLVAILHGSAAEFERAHVALPQRLARACRVANVRRVVHVSALGAAADAPSNYLRSKAAGEAALRTAGLGLTVLRPSVIFGAEDRFMKLFAQLQAVFPLVPLAGADAKFQPVWVEDVAAAIVKSLVAPRPEWETIECAGPRVYTLAELVRLAGHWSGHERPVIPLPAALGRIQARLLALAPGTPLMSPDNLDSMRVPNVASGTLPGLQALGITPTALEAIGPSYLSAGRGPARLDAWRALARRR